jgi:RNA polymerase sigma-70 factor, ECF subfamily
MRRGQMDDGDFDQFYEACAHRVVGVLYAMTGDLAHAQDVVQEAFVRAWDHRAKIDVSPEVWVRTTAHRLATSRWRRLRAAVTGSVPRQALPAIGAPDLPDPEVIASLRRLPETQRQAVVLYYLCDRSVDQIAIESEAQVSIVTGRLSRGQNALAESGRLDAVRSDLKALSERAEQAGVIEPADLASAATQLRALGGRRRHRRVLGSAGLLTAGVAAAVIIAVTGTAHPPGSAAPLNLTSRSALKGGGAVDGGAVRVVEVLPQPDPANDVGYLTAAELVDGHLVITFDRVTWLVGPLAAKHNGGVTPAGGHLIINSNTRLRTFVVDDAATLLGNVQLGDGGDWPSTRITRKQLIERTANLVGSHGRGPLVTLQHRLGVDGPVSRLREIGNP